jgi:serine/threonine-protein kinase
MGDGERDRVEELFTEAAELPPERRAAFLDATCGDDATLRAEVEELLAYDNDGGGADASPVPSFASPTSGR